MTSNLQAMQQLMGEGGGGMGGMGGATEGMGGAMGAMAGICLYLIMFCFL